MAISRITGAGIATDTLEAGDIAADAVGSSEIAADAVGLSELNDATGVTSTHHKVPSFADADARDAAISSPANGMLIFNTDIGAVQQYNGNWATIAPPPNITSVSGFLNEDTDSTITVFGTNFTSSSAVKMFDASAGGSQVGSNATTTFNSASKLTAVFGGAGVPVAGDAVYIEVDNAGATNRFATAITVNADPTATFTGGTGTNYAASTHLGTYGGSTAGGGDDQYTNVLLNFDRAGGTDMEDSSNIGFPSGGATNDYWWVGHKVAALGNANIKSSPFGDGKTAMFFDGSDDKLLIADHADWDFGTGDFTIEFWTKCNRDGSTGAVFIAGKAAWGSGAGWSIKHNMTNGYIGYQYGSTDYTSTTNINDDIWHHIALVKNGDNLNLYVDGISINKATGLNSTAFPDEGAGIAVGCLTGSANFFKGYLDEIRIVKGTAVYTAAFDIPTTRLTAITNTKLLIHSNQTYDASGNANVVIDPAGSDSLQTTTRKWTHAGAGAWSMGSSTAGFMAATDLPNFAASAALTIETWWKPSDTSGSEYLFDWRNRDATGGHIYAYTTGSNIHYKKEGIGEDQSGYTGTTNWTHIAFVRDTSGNGASFFDGNRKGSWTGDTNAISATYSNFVIGSRCSFGEHFEGHLDDFRVSNTARYDPTATTYTVPTATFTSDANTLLLLNGDHFGFTDSSSSSHTITPTGAYHSANHLGIAPAIAWPGSGKRYGSCGVYFDGDTSDGGDRVAVNANSTPNPLNMVTIHTQTKTIEFWFYYYPMSHHASLVRSAKVDNSAGGDYNFRFYLNSNGTQLAAYYLQGGSYVTGTSSYHVNDFQTAYPPLRWWHFAFCNTSVSGSSGVSKLYINGKYVPSNSSTYQDQWWKKLMSPENHPLCFGGGQAGGEGSLHGYIDHVRLSSSIRYTGNDQSAFWSNTGFTAQPTKLFGGIDSTTIPTITFTGAATQLAADEDVEFTSVDNTAKADGSRSLTDTDVGLTLTNLTGADKSKATLTGTLTSGGGTTHTNMPMKVQVRKTLGDAAYANASRVVTFSGSTVTTGLASAMPVTGTGIPASTTITSVDSTTTITLSANPTGGTLTGQSLIFEDPTRVAYMNGTDTLDNAQSMLSIATGTGLGSKLFNARRYVGDADPGGVTGFGFQPDLIWTKKRSAAEAHGIFDSVRGSTNRLFVNTNQIATSGGATSFDKDGFTTSDGYGTDSENEKSYIAWGWKAGGPVISGVELVGTGATMSGTSGAGTIHNSATGVTSCTNITQSVSQTTGFSITKFLGIDAGGAFPHNLGGTPAMIIMKQMDVGTQSWFVWHQNLSATTGKYLALDTNAAETSDAGAWTTAPSSTIITTGTKDGSGGNAANFICYAWKTVAGVSAFGTYEGNGSAKTVTLPNSETFTPRMVLIKNIDQNDNWRILDKFRGFSGSGTSLARALAPDTDSAESTGSVGITVGSGQWVMNTSDGAINGSSETYIYAAFA